MLTVPPTGLLTVLIIRVWPLSLAGPFESLAVKVEARLVRHGGDSFIHRRRRLVHFRHRETNRRCVTLRIGRTIRRAVVGNRVLEAGYSVEVSRRREIDIGCVPADRSADRIADTRQG